MHLHQSRQFVRGQTALYAVCVVAVIAVVGFSVFWFGCRIHPKPGEFVAIVKMTGEPLTNDMEIAESTENMGCQLDILRDGRRFYNPIDWNWTAPQKVVEVGSDEVAVLIRLFGKDLPPGETIAPGPEYKGVVREVRMQGRLDDINSVWGYRVELHPTRKIEPGFAGLVTLLAGKVPENPNVFVVKEGECGMQPFLLPVGTHPEFSNPYVYCVQPVDIRAQKFEISEGKELSFPSSDGFDITSDGVVEYDPVLSKLPELYVKFVDAGITDGTAIMRSIENNLLYPAVRSFYRTRGGKHSGVDFISGAVRKNMQDEIEADLRVEMAKEGINIRSFVIRTAEPPKKVREQYERREIAKRKMEQYAQETTTLIGVVVMEGGTPKLGPDGKPELGITGEPVIVGGTPKLGPDGKPMRKGGKVEQIIQRQMKDREGQFGGVRSSVAEDVRKAEQYAAVETTKAKTKLEIAKLRLESAKDKAAAVVVTAEAEAASIEMKQKAEAEGIRSNVAALGDGLAYAEYLLIKRYVTAVQQILTNTDGEFADVLKRFLGKRAVSTK